ncbi:MAG: beta-eliminating lyase-related protein [Polyangia bacterium]
MTPDDRQRCLERASYNVLLLDPADIEYDLLTDVPSRSFVSSVNDESARAAAIGAREPDLAALAEAIYGPARYVVATKGRSAELALLSALSHKLRKPRLVVVTHGLFRTVQHALHRHGNATIELAPTAPPTGTADLDLAWLEQRLARGDVDVVYLEPCNNTLGGWPLSLENTTQVRALCSTAGALLVLDVPRLLANIVSLGLPLSTAAQFCALADAFTVSCSKELLTPYGALVAVRDEALEHAVFSYCFDEGTLLEPLDARVRLAAGMKAIARDLAPLHARRALLVRLSEGLRRAGIEVLDPIGGHAVYVPVPASALGTVPLRARALEGWLYTLSGVRALAFPNPVWKRVVIRLPLPLARFHDADVDRMIEGITAFFGRTAEARNLAVRSSGPNPMLARFQPT